jgi:hypothetical protein
VEEIHRITIRPERGGSVEGTTPLTQGGGRRSRQLRHHGEPRESVDVVHDRLGIFSRQQCANVVGMRPVEVAGARTGRSERSRHDDGAGMTATQMELDPRSRLP